MADKKFSFQCSSCKNTFDYYLKSHPMVVRGKKPSPDSTTDNPVVEVCLQCPCKDKDGKECATWNSFDVNTKAAEGSTVQGFPRSENRVKTHETWISETNDYIRDMADAYNTEADKFGTLFTAIFGVYTTILVFFGLSNSNTSSTLISLDPWVRVAMFLPIVAWVVGIAALFLVKKPVQTGDAYIDSSESYLLQYSMANQEKSRLFSIAMIAFAAGFVIMIFSVLFGIFAGPASVTPAFENQTVQFIVSEQGYPILKNLPITIDGNKTSPMQLTNITESGYEVTTSSGESFQIAKDWVTLMVVLPSTTTVVPPVETSPVPTSPAEAPTTGP